MGGGDSSWVLVIGCSEGEVAGMGEDFFCNRGGRRKIEAIMTIKTGIKTRTGMPLSGLGSRGTGVGLGGN